MHDCKVLILGHNDHSFVDGVDADPIVSRIQQPDISDVDSLMPGLFEQPYKPRGKLRIDQEFHYQAALTTRWSADLAA